MNLLKRVFTRTNGRPDNCAKKVNGAATATPIAWETYEFLDATDKRLIESAFGGEIDVEGLSNLLSKMHARTYLLELAADRRECPASDCESYRGYVVAGEPGARLIVTGKKVTCSRCARTCHRDHFDQEGRNKLAAAIGEALAKKGGIELMHAVAAKFSPQRKVYVLSHSWNGVGGWFA